MQVVRGIKSVLSSFGSGRKKHTNALGKDNADLPGLNISLFALEQRIMFDGAAIVTGAEVVQDTTTYDQTEIPGSKGKTSSDSGTTLSFEEAFWASGLSLPTLSDRREIVFIDTIVEGFQTLMEGIDPHAEVILLDSTRDGIEQISEILSERSDIDAVHIISHGDAGELRIGTGVLDLASMQGEYADELATINQALTEEADFLIYGCKFGEGEDGRKAATFLAQLTGADVAASNDLTGAEALGGDWDLEVQTGRIESNVVVDEQAQEEFAGVLDITSNLVAHYEMNEGSGTTATDATANNNDGTHQGSTSHVMGKIGSGALDFSTDTSSNDRVEVADDASLDFGSGDFSVGFWFKSSTTPASQARVIGQHSGSGDGWLMFVDSLGDLRVQVDGGGSQATLEANGLLDGNWHHIVLVRSGNFFSLFVDTSFEDGVSVSVGSVNNTETLYIGSSPSSDFDGQLDEVRLYDRALSGSDVTEFFNYTGSNTAPSITNLGGDTLAYTEGAGAQVIDQSSNAAVSDVDSSDFDTGTLTVAFTAGSDSAEDVLSLRDQGTGAGQIGVSGSTVSYVGTTIGTFTGGSGGVALVITLNANADAAAVGALTQNITYENTDTNNPTTTARTVRYVLTDGDGGTSANYDTTVTVSGVNDAPTFSIGDGTVITDFGSILDLGASSVIQPDGKILVAGLMHNGTNFDFAVVRYNIDGSLDTSFSGDGMLTTAIGADDDFGRSVTLQPDGKILVAGYAYAGGNNDFALVRYNSDGTLDASFSGDGKLTTEFSAGAVDLADSVVVQPDGKILVGGHTSSAGNNDFALVRYNSDGTLDTSFSGDGKLTTDIGAANDIARSVTVQTDGKILLAGYSGNDLALVRYNADGTLDTSFDTDGMLTTSVGNIDRGVAVTIQPDGKILVAGYTIGPTFDFIVVRYHSDGTLDSSFSGDGIAADSVGTGLDLVYDIVLQADNKILVAGYSTVGSFPDFAVIRYNADGTLDTSFSGDGKLTTSLGPESDIAYSINVQTDGKIVVAGTTSVGSDNDFAVVRYNSDGTLDTSFDSAFTNTLDGAPSFTEGGPAVVLDADVNISDSELDSLNSGNGNYSGASLTLVRNGGANSEDVFSFNVGNGITLSGGTLIKNSQIIATFDTTAILGQLVITFTDVNGEIPTSVDVDNILRQITYSNSSDNPPVSSQIDWSFHDGNTGSQGSGGAKQATGSTTITITAVNDVPVITNLGGDTLAYTEGDGAQVIDQSSNAAVSDVDSSDFDTGTLTVAFTAGSDSAEDVLSIRHQGTGAGQIGVSGSTITYEGTTIGAFTGGTGGTDLVITLNVNADATAVGALTQNIMYENTDTANPTTTVRTVRYVLTDGDGGASANYDTTVTVSGVNDAPVNTVPGAQWVLEDTPLAISGISVNDVDGNLSTVQLAVGNGTLTVTLSGGATISAGANGSGTLTLFGSQTDINATLNSLSYQGMPNYNGFDTLTVTSSDANSATDVDMVAITVSAVNDAPFPVNDNYAAIEDNVLTVSSVGTGLLANDFDVDGDSLSVNTTPASGPSNGTLILNANGTFTYTPNTNFNGVDTFTYEVSDGNGGTAQAIASITVFAVNDVPSITNLGGDTLAYTEGDGAQVIDQSSNAAVSDVDSSDFDTGTLTVAFTAGSDSAEDVLSIRHQGTGAGQIGVSGSTITYEGTTIGAFTGGTGGTDLVITLNVNADATAVGALTQNITYENTDTANPTTTVRTVRYVLTDGDGGASANYDTTVTVSGVNDAPVLDNSGVMSLTTITEDNTNNSGDLVSAIIASAGGDRITDVDAGAVEGIAISSLVSSNGIWQYNIGSGWTNVGTVSIGSSLLLRATDSLRFVPDGLNADTAAVTFAAWDQTSGSAGTKVDTSVFGGTTAFSALLETAVISVTAVNDDPIITSDGGGPTAAVNAAENQTSVTTVTATDADLPADTLTYSIIGGADQALFAINSSSGVLTFTSARDFETFTDVNTDGVYEVMVQVADGQGGTDTQAISVTVTDLQEVLPAPPPSPPEPTPGPPPEPPPEPTPDPESGPDPEISLPLLNGNYGQVVGRGPDPEEQLDQKHEIVDILDLPPFLHPARPMTLDQIRAYYPDPLDMTKTTLPVEFLQQLNRFSDQLQQTMNDQVERNFFFVKMMKASGLALSAGLVAWLIRGGALLTWFMASLPAWRHFDPVPILSMNKGKKKDWDRRVIEVATLEAREHQGLDKIL